jgi:AcrR family transcriptional regulator
VRRQRAAETHESIVAAGIEIAHERAPWNWSSLTVREVAARAGVNESTVYRHFESERNLQDAILRRLEAEAGITTLSGLRLEDLTSITERSFTFVSSFPLEPRTNPGGPALELDRQRREALLAAIAPATAAWPRQDVRMAAAGLDVLWSLVNYERLVAAWELEPAEATRALTWVMRLAIDAIERGARPGAAELETGPRTM